MLVGLTENNSATLVIKADTIHYLGATDETTEIHFGTGYPITVRHSLEDIYESGGEPFRAEWPPLKSTPAIEVEDRQVTPAQCRAARALIDLSVAQLSGLPVNPRVVIEE